MQSSAIDASSLLHVSNEQRSKGAAKAPRSQHESVNRPHILRAEVISCERGHGAESAAVTHKDDSCTRNITTNVARLVIESDAQAQNTLPKAFPMLTTPTMLAAAIALTRVNCWNNGDSCEITEIPAEVFKNSSNHSAHHCQVLSASPSV